MIVGDPGNDNAMPDHHIDVHQDLEQRWWWVLYERRGTDDVVVRRSGPFARPDDALDVAHALYPAVRTAVVPWHLP